MHNEFHEEAEETFGPGSDLMISLFAVSILLLGIVGAGTQYDSIKRNLGEIEEAEAKAKAVELAQTRAPAAIAPPLKLISQADFDAETRRRQEAEAREVKLQDDMTALKNKRDQEKQERERLRALLDEAENKLVLLKAQTPDGRLDLASDSYGVNDIAAYMDQPNGFYIDLAPRTVDALKKAISYYPQGVNQLFIETTVPAGLLAYLPADTSGEMAMEALYRLSSALTQSYQQAFLRAGVPIVCVSMIARGFEDTPEVRREIVYDAQDAIDAYSQLLTFYRNTPKSQISSQAAEVHLSLGTDAARPCDAEILKTKLQSMGSN